MSNNDALLREVLSGLQSTIPTLPCKLFYDERGSQLYEQITELAEYYPYAAEMQILEGQGPDIAKRLGEAPVVVEYGSGSSVKTRLLLDALAGCSGYMPIDISKAHLLTAAQRLRQDYRELAVEPLHADFTEPVSLPPHFEDADNRVAFFPGSTIGNFNPDEATGLLRNIRDTLGDGGQLLIGVDIPKDRAALELAYDDPAGVTAAFNLNILNHVNRLLDADFDPDGFRHEAIWNKSESRIEMHLRCTRSHQVAVAGTILNFDAGQSIRTECSYKYAPEQLQAIGRQAGLQPETVWFDDLRRYSMHLLRAND